MIFVATAQSIRQVRHPPYRVSHVMQGEKINMKRSSVKHLVSVKESIMRLLIDNRGKWFSKKIGKNSKDFKIEMQAYDTSKQFIKPLMEEIEKLVQSKIFPT